MYSKTLMWIRLSSNLFKHWIRLHAYLNWTRLLAQLLWIIYASGLSLDKTALSSLLMGWVKPPPSARWQLVLFHFIVLGPHKLTFYTPQQSIKILAREVAASAKAAAKSVAVLEEFLVQYLTYFLYTWQSTMLCSPRILVWIKGCQ